MDGSGNWQIWTADINTDGTGWSAAETTTNNYEKRNLQLQVTGDKVYYAWNEMDGSGNYQIWTADMNTDGTGWSATERTTTSYNKFCPQLQVVGSKVYYTWYENDGANDQIWTAEMGSNILNKGDFYGIGIMGNTAKGFVDAGVDGFKYKGNAISYTAGAAEEATINTNWNHVAMTYDKTDLKFYVNGVLSGTTAFTEEINTNTFKMIIGDDFNGTIDEVRIWNDVRTETEIQNNMYGELSNPTGEANLVSYYKLNETKVGTNSAIDSKGTNNGTPTNMTDANCVTSTAPIPYFTVQDGNWNTNTTWASGQDAPTNNWACIETEHELTVNSNEGANDVTIAPSGAMTVNDANTLTVTGDLTIKSDATGTGSLIEDCGIEAIMERYIVGHADNSNHGWHLLGSPVATFVIKGSTFEPGTSDDLYRWEETTALWMNHKAGDPLSIVPGTGYLTAWQTTTTKTFTGTLNNSDITKSNLSHTSNSNTGWHLLGNPFPCALLWDATSWNLSASVNGTAKIWNETSASYTDIPQNGIIPATQGFMVNVTSSKNSITIPLADRTHSTQPWYKNDETNKIKLTAYDAEGGTAQESIIKFNENATTGFDNEHDSKFLAGNAPLFYSIAGGENLSTNTLPEITEGLGIPLCFIKNTSGTFYIEAEGMDNLFPSYPVYLTDLKTNHTQSLTDNPVYSFTSNEGDDPARFLLHFKLVGIDEGIANNNIQVWSANKTIHVLNPDHLNGTMRIVNVHGQEILKSQMNGDTKQEIHLNVPAAYYIVNIVYEKGVVNRKIYLR